MIPILFDKDETAFASNGIGRLRDCISCVCTEERNGIYEVDFQYPVDGANYSLIECGKFIGVTHDETGDIQPFEIVSVSRPISGIVSFHAVHLSYRQSQMVVAFEHVTTPQQAFNVLKLASPDNPFEYETDIDTTAYMSASDRTPRSVRQFLGGVKGSILDTYGGEYEWDKWTVKLHSARGEYKDFAIRYGVNLLDYNDSLSYQGTFTSCVAYWMNNEGRRVTTTATLGQTGYNGRDIWSVLNLTDKFENEPTESALQAEALSYMRRNNSNLPTQSIRVDFVRLSDMGEFSAYQDLLKCKLCDTVRVIFPMYDVSASFKIVRTEWDVLRGRYASMELGNLSTTLSEALGIEQPSTGSASDTADYIVEQGTSGIWTYRKWNSGIAECWGYTASASIACTSPLSGSSVYYSAEQTIAFPSGLFNDIPKNVQVSVWDGGYGTYGNISSWNKNNFLFYYYSPKSQTRNMDANILAQGRWK